MNIAIILPVPHYEKIAALPGCAGDGRAIQTLLSATKRFSEQLFVNDTRADHAREQIIKFLEKYHNEHVDELLFYYSGHGYVADDFLCCASDFDPNRPQSTSISNKELDDLFRELKPNLVTKLVDSCSSGIRFIKDPSVFRGTLATKGFKEYIYFASCMDDQSSFASPLISDFTKEFVSAVRAAQADMIRYIHIQNYLVDSFQANNIQSPYFIVQATGREIFSDNTDDVRNACDNIINEIESQMQQPEKITLRGLLGKLEDKDKEYPPLESATASLTAFKDRLARLTLENERLESVYEIKLETDASYDQVPAIDAIAKNVNRTPARERLVEVVMERKRIENVNPITGFPSHWPFGSTYRHPEPIDLTLLATELQMVYAIVRAQPRFKCIDPMSIALVFVPFRTRCRIFWTLLRYQRSGWDQFAPDGDNVKWTCKDYKWDTLIEAFDVVVNLEGLSAALIEHVEAMVGVEAVPEDDGNG